jgi:two-component system sensor histidine kinase/response regulator
VQTGLKMGSIIDELLLLSAVRNTDVKTEPLDMKQIMTDAQARLALMIEEHQAEITLTDTWPASIGHSAWIEEVWANYLSNAIKYGGRPPRVELGGTMQPDGMVRFWIKDNGPGITPEDQDRLFSPFTRLDRDRANGHGLGLSIVRRIVEKLGGQVGIESEPGRGTVFSFTLPSVACPAEAEYEDHQASVPQRSTVPASAGYMVRGS